MLAEHANFQATGGLGPELLEGFMKLAVCLFSLARLGAIQGCDCDSSSKTPETTEATNPVTPEEYPVPPRADPIFLAVENQNIAAKLEALGCVVNPISCI